MPPLPGHTDGNNYTNIDQSINLISIYETNLITTQSCIANALSASMQYLTTLEHWIISIFVLDIVRRRLEFGHVMCRAHAFI